MYFFLLLGRPNYGLIHTVNQLIRSFYFLWRFTALKNLVVGGGGGIMH